MESAGSEFGFSRLIAAHPIFWSYRMTPSRPLDRQYAYLRVIGTGDPKTITDLLGLEPDYSWEEGEKYESRCREFTRKFTGWYLESGLDESFNIDDHIEAILKQIRHLSDNFSNLPAEYTAQFVIVGYYNLLTDILISNEVMRELVELGFEFWFDFYPRDDMHEEIVELREQIYGAGYFRKTS